MNPSSGGDFIVKLNLPPGIHEYKFIVNQAHWCSSKTSPTLTSKDTMINNVIHVTSETLIHENLVV